MKRGALTFLATVLLVSACSSGADNADESADADTRIERVDVVDATHADVVYTLLLDGAAVLDQLPGAAVKPGATWLVSRRTFCDVATQGVQEIPQACQ